MTSTELIELLQKLEKGASGESCETTIYKEDGAGELVCLMKESDAIKFLSSGDGCAGSELSLVIKEKA